MSDARDYSKTDLDECICYSYAPGPGTCSACGRNLEEQSLPFQGEPSAQEQAEECALAPRPIMRPWRSRY